MTANRATATVNKERFLVSITFPITLSETACRQLHTVLARRFPHELLATQFLTGAQLDMYTKKDEDSFAKIEAYAKRVARQ